MMVHNYMAQTPAKDPVKHIINMVNTIPDKLMPRYGLSDFHLTNTLLHSYAIAQQGYESVDYEDAEREFMIFHAQHTWAMTFYGDDCHPGDTYLALQKRLDNKGGIYKKPLEFTIFHEIGHQFFHQQGVKQVGTVDKEFEELADVYGLACFLNLFLNYKLKPYEPFNAEWKGIILKAKRMKFSEENMMDVSARLWGYSEYFKWPKTLIAPSSGVITDEKDWPQEGVLKFMGYSVGKTKGVSLRKRHSILQDVYAKAIPNVMDSAHMAEWGKPRTAVRLKKMAESIASFTKNAKRKKQSGLAVAIKEWEDDLAWLRKEFYDGVHDRTFTWPRINV